MAGDARSRAAARADQVAVLVGEQRNLGDRALATGDAEVYVHPVPFLREWDTCAPEAVLRGAGGSVSDCRGEALAYGKQEPRQLHGIFASRADVWAEALPLVREVTSGKLGFDP